MTRNKLEKCLGQHVSIIFFDGTRILGILHKTGEEEFKDEANLFIPQNYYFCTDKNNNLVENCIFKCSHISSLVMR